MAKNTFDNLEKAEAQLLKRLAPISEQIYASTKARDELLKKSLEAQQKLLDPFNNLTYTIGEKISGVAHHFDDKASTLLLDPITKASDDINKFENNLIGTIAKESELAFCFVHPQCCLKHNAECDALRAEPLK